MSTCRPASALSNKLSRHHWKVIPYQLGTKAQPGMAGELIWASMETDAPTVRLPLGVSGWYAIYVGLYTTTFAPAKAWLSLDGDLGDQPVSATVPAPEYWNLEEVFYRVAEIAAGTELSISQQTAALSVSIAGKGCLGCGFAYVKLVPLSDGEIAALRADREDRAPRRLALTNDGTSPLAIHRPTTRRELMREIEPLRNTDFGTYILHIGGSIQVTYPSQVGEPFAQGIDDFPDVGTRYIAESVRILAKKKINPVKEWIDGAHRLGMKVLVGFRPAIWGYYEPLNECFSARFFAENPQWRVYDRDGTPVGKMSWAVPEVRQRQIEVVREAVRFGADGAHIVFTRAWPVVLFEQPFVDAFQKEYGENPRQLEENDPRIWKLRADIVTTFIQELRDMLAQEDRRREGQKRLELSMCVMNNDYDNLQFGLDIRRIVNAGLVDELYPYYWWSFGSVKGGTIDFKFFHDVCAPKGIPVIPMLTADVIKPDQMAEWAKKTQELYDQGAAGVAFWDLLAETGGTMSRFVPVSRFGHPTELKELIATPMPKPTYVPLLRVGDKILDQRYLPTWGG
jgi:hypothetical protein